MKHVVIIGAGIGGLSAAALLAARGFRVTVVEKEAAPGGKIRTLTPHTLPIDAGPTVFTMRWVFDALFAECGADLDSALVLKRAHILARHAWPDGSRLDLHADQDATTDAIAAFAGPREAAGYRAFAAEAKAIFETLDASFMRAPRPSPLGLTARIGLARLPDLLSIRPWTPLWRALGDHFRDPRLRQLFGRYATYAGSSPFAAPATLMLIAHAEACGVWLVEGGMHALARAVEGLARARGAEFRYGSSCESIVSASGRAVGIRLIGGEVIAADHVISNADPSMFGAAARTPPRHRSLSALTLAIEGRASGFPLVRHNVFFSGDYVAEFAALRGGRLPRDPTVYVCAQDRTDDAKQPDEDRLLLIVNAPANGDAGGPSQTEIDECAERTIASLSRAGLSIDVTAQAVTGPAEWARLFPGSGGALYGRASHGSMGAFRRPGWRSRLKNLWLAGGATHPGAGVPMAALSGRLAADAITRAST